MGRIKRGNNIQSSVRSITSTLSPQASIKFLANLIIDKILEDQRNGVVLLKKLTE